MKLHRAFVVYLTIMVIISLVTAALIIPSAPLPKYIALLTFGLGIPLLYLPTLPYYGLCFLPFVALWVYGWPARLVGLVLSVVATIVAAIGPAFLANRQAYDLATEQTKSDISLNKPIEARTLELRLNKFSKALGIPRPPPRAGSKRFGFSCGRECQHLLFSGQVDWVRVVLTDMHTASETKHTSLYKMGQPADCAEKGFGNPCVIDSPDTKTPAALVVALQLSMFEDDPYIRTMLISSYGKNRIAAYQLKDGSRARVLLQTEPRIGVAASPAYIGPRFLSANEYIFDGATKRYNKISFPGALRSLGFDLPASEKE